MNAMYRLMIESIALILAGILFCRIPVDMLQYQAVIYITGYYLAIRIVMAMAAAVVVQTRKERHDNRGNEENCPVRNISEGKLSEECNDIRNRKNVV